MEANEHKVTDTSAYLNVYECGGTVQLAIMKENVGGPQGGYRIAGPSFNGDSELLLRKKLNAGNAEDIRHVLDAAFPQGPKALSESQQFQVSEARDILGTWDLDNPGGVSRETVLADQVRTLLGIIDQAFPAATAAPPVMAGNEPAVRSE